MPTSNFNLYEEIYRLRQSGMELSEIEKAISLIDSNKSNVKIIREEDFIHTFTI